MEEPTMKKSGKEMSIENKDSASAHFEALRDELFHEAAELISEVPLARIAIVITPPAGSGSNVSTYSFGHPSAKDVFKTFLEDKGKDKAPMEDEDDGTEDEDVEEEKDLSSRRGWWNDAKKLESMSPQQLKAAFNQLTRLKNRLSLERETRSSGNPDAEPKP